VFNCRYVTDSKWDNVYAGALDLYVSSGFSHRLYDGYYFNRFNQNVIESGQIVVSNDGITARGNTDQSFGAELSVSGGLRIFGAAGKGIWLGGACGGVYLDRIDISECFRGVYLDDTLAGATNREVFLDSGLTIDSCTGWGLNIEANGVALLEADGPWIASCGNSTTNEGGIRIAPSSGMSARWSNLRVYSCYYDGIQLNSGTHNFSGGFIRNCGTGTPGGHGLLIVACDHLLCNGMTIHNNGNVTRGYGISIAGTVNNYTVQGNYLFGNGQGAVYQPSGPSLTQTVRDNLGYTTENSGLAVVPSGSSTVVVNHGLDDTPTFVEVGFCGTYGFHQCICLCRT
jgi:hypothetical protein